MIISETTNYLSTIFNRFFAPLRMTDVKPGNHIGHTQNSVDMQSINFCGNSFFSLSLQFEKKKDLSSTEDITFAMRNRQEWFNEKIAADIIARIYAILGLSCTCMNNNSNNL